MTKVSVIICTYPKERVSETLGCIDSLRKQTRPPEETILVLDNPNEDLGSLYHERVPDDVVVVFSEGHGLGNARNTGVRKAGGDVLAFIDDDATADRQWLENLLQSYQDVHVIGVGGLVRPVWESGRPCWFPEELDWIVGCSYKGVPEHRSGSRNPLGCNMSFRREAFDKIGGFGLKSRVGSILLGGDEAEFSVRLLRNIPGSKIIIDPSAVTYHRVPRHRKTFRYFLRRSFYEGLSKRIMETVEPNSLSLERQYLSQLLRLSLPSRLTRIHEAKSVLQCFAILLSILFVFAGYASGGIGSAEWAYVQATSRAD